MINRIFIVSTQNVGTNAFAVSDETHFCIEVNPADNNDMSNAYQLMSATGNNLSLFLAIHDLLSETSLHSILSFLFLPTYNQSHRSPVIHITGESDELVNRSIHLLSEAIKEQGFENFVVEKVPADILFESTEAIIAHYKEVLQSEVFFGNNLFFKVWY